MNSSAGLTALVPAGVMTVTLTVPVVPGGELTVIEVGEPTLTLVAAAVPKSTALAPVKPLPVTTTVVPPAGRPAAGLSEATDGAPS